MKNILDFRKLLIDTMVNSGLLINNILGEGYTDWHTKENDCGITFKLNTGEKFSMIISQDKE